MLAQVLPNLALTETEYLAQEHTAQERHEYVNGQVFAMAGASKTHNEIALNLALALGENLYRFRAGLNT